MKKTLKVLKYVGIIAASFFIGAMFMANGDSTETTTEPVAKETTTQPVDKTKTETPAPVPKVEKKEEPVKTAFAFGEEATFESGLVVKAVSVEETAERNQFAEPYLKVMIVHAELTNTTSEEMVVWARELNVQDSQGFQGETYPAADQLVSIGPGGKAKVEFAYGIDGEGPYKVIGGPATWE